MKKQLNGLNFILQRGNSEFILMVIWKPPMQSSAKVNFGATSFPVIYFPVIYIYIYIYIYISKFNCILNVRC